MKNGKKYFLQKELKNCEYFRDSKSGNIFTADGGSKYLQSLAPTEGECIIVVTKWGTKSWEKNPNYDPTKANAANTVDNTKIYEAVEKAVFLLNNPGVSYDDWGCSYAAQPYKVYDASRGGQPAWVNRNKDDWAYNIFGEKYYPQVHKQYPMKMFHQWSQNNMLVFAGWSLVHMDVIRPTGLQQYHNLPVDWQPDMTKKEDVLIYMTCVDTSADIVKENSGSATAPNEALRLQITQIYMNMK